MELNLIGRGGASELEMGVRGDIGLLAESDFESRRIDTVAGVGDLKNNFGSGANKVFVEWPNKFDQRRVGINGSGSRGGGGSGKVGTKGTDWGNRAGGGGNRGSD